MGQTTTIRGAFPLPIAVGPVCGTINITWPDFTAPDGTFMPAGEQTVTLAHDNSYNFELTPTIGGTESAYYTATYSLSNGGSMMPQRWTVPATTASLTIPEILVTKTIPPLPFQIQASQIYSATANIGDCLVFNGSSFVPVTLQASFPFVFTNQSTLVIPASQHGQGSSLFVEVYSAQGVRMQPGVEVAPIVGDVTVTFGSAQSGYGFVYGGLGRSLPNRAKGFYGVATGTFLQTEHRFNSPYLAVRVMGLDAAGLMAFIDAGATVTVNPLTYDVTVTLSAPQDFSVIVLGSLGTATPVNVTGTASNSPEVPYVQPVTAQTSVPIPTSTHNKGIYPRAFAFTNDSPPVSANLDYSVDSAGNIVATFEPAFSGSIWVF